MFVSPKKALLAAACFFLAPTLSFASPIVNGDFSAGTSGWQTLGTFTTESEEGLFSDLNGTIYLYQPVSISQGQTYTLSLDFLNALSNVAAGEGDGDTVFFTLLTGDTFADVESLVSSTATYLSLVDFIGPTPYISVGSIGPSDKGGNWQKYSYTFVALTSYIGISIDLFNLNGQRGDSEFRVDNIAVRSPTNAVPEPLTAGLLLCAIPLLRRRRA